MDAARKITTREIVKKLIKGEDYRIVTQTEINTRFLNYCIGFFKKVIEAKMNNQNITMDWYKSHFVMNDAHSPADRAIYAGINKKTITNMFNSGTKEIVISASEDSYDTLVTSIEHLLEENSNLDLQLSIKFNGVSVELNLNESLVVINSLAVKRAAIRGGAYSATGKNVEGPLMVTLCKLFKVSEDNYKLNIVGGGKASYGDFEREIDFFLEKDGIVYKCEVKLMGKGNPESADAFIARESNVFIADKLSTTNTTQFDSLGAYWVELRSNDGFLRFEKALKAFNIEYQMPEMDDLDGQIDLILDEILK
ncbi:CfrBI family restriction endonuclease [Gelidibacter japonicus]|uniref:CfrBI family restriction endonuclease n=1 Tax=Gelidibacter japonicus TaxID=1962232 RepID=UPI003A9123D1